MVYTGTHDNDTIDGWFHTIPEEDAAFCRDYLRLNEAEGYHWGFIKGAWASVGDTAIAQMQDFLNLDTSARMNTPSTVGCNWKMAVNSWCVGCGACPKNTAYHQVIWEA